MLMGSAAAFAAGAPHSPIQPLTPVQCQITIANTANMTVLRMLHPLLLVNYNEKT